MNNKVFTEYSVPKAVFTMAVPTMLSMLLTIFYNLADTFFVGQTGDPFQVAAVSLVGPYFLLFTALANIFGQGGSSCISRALGEGNEKNVKHFSAFSFYGAIISGIVLAVFTIAIMTPLLKLLGCSENTFQPAFHYLTIVAGGGVFITLANTMSHLTRAEGDSKSAMAGMMIGTIINIILDPIMILAMGLGVKGAAWATVIGNVVSVIYYIIKLKRPKTGLSLSFGDFTMESEISWGVLSIGIPTFISNTLMSAAAVVYNNFVAAYGDNAVAGMGVAQRANMVVFMIQLGLAVGIAPLVGFAYGAKDYRKLGAVLRFSSLCTFILGTVLSVILWIFAAPIVTAFIKDDLVISYGTTMLRAMMLSGPIVGIMFVLQFSLQAMGRAKSALILSLSRQGIVFLPVLFLMNHLLGLQGVIYCQPIADVGTLIMCLILFYVDRPKLDEEEVA